MSATVTVEMPEDEFARRWLGKKCLCAVDWSVIEEMATVYRVHGRKELVFDPESQTFTLRDKAKAAA